MICTFAKEAKGVIADVVQVSPLAIVTYSWVEGVDFGSENFDKVVRVWVAGVGIAPRFRVLLSYALDDMKVVWDCD